MNRSNTCNCTFIFKNYTKNMPHRFLRCAIAFRFLLLFAFACAIGILSVQHIGIENHSDTFSKYLASFSSGGFWGFIQNCLSTAKFNLLLLLISALSVLTFFCSATLHILSVLFGGIYGICIGIIVFSFPTALLAVYIYLIETVAFAVFFSLAAESFLNLNRSILNDPKNNTTKKQHVSPLFRALFIKTAQFFAIYAMLHILYSIIMFLISTQLTYNGQ